MRRRDIRSAAQQAPGIGDPLSSVQLKGPLIRERGPLGVLQLHCLKALLVALRRAKTAEGVGALLPWRIALDRG